MLKVQQKNLELTTEIEIKTINDYFNGWTKQISVIKEWTAVKKNLPIILSLTNDQENSEYKLAKQNLFDQINDLKALHNDLDSIFFVNSEGKIFLSTNQARENKTISEAFPWFGQLSFEKGKNQVFVSKIFQQAEDGTLDFLVCAPIFDYNETFSGVMFFEINSSEISKAVQSSVGLGATEEILVVRMIVAEDRPFLESLVLKESEEYLLFLINSRFDQTVAFKKVIQIGENVALPAQEAAQGRSGLGESVDYQGKKVLAVWHYLPEYDLGLVTKIDLAEVLIPVNAVIKAISVFGVVAILMILLIAWTSARTIYLPILELSRAVEKIRKGDLNVRVLVNSNDEIGVLANTFNLMVSAIAESRGKIEKKVLERTQELAARNQDLEQAKIATLDILKAVEKEKEKSQALASDLEKFKLAVDNASDHIIITDADGKILYANKGVERITGFSVKEVLGQKVGSKDNWGGLMSLEVYKKLWQTIKEKKQVFVGQLENHRKSGEKYEVLASISPIINAAGQVVFFVGIERDITKEREIDKAKTEFVSLASHQLRTPLTAINWYTEMLLAGDAGKMNKDQKKFVSEIYKGNKRMVALVNALLNVSRLELGTFTIEPKPCQIIEIADSVLSEIQPQIKTRKQKLIKEYAVDLPIMQLDEKLIRIVFQNLLTNAVKYTPEAGSVKLEIRKKARTVEISVSDTGLGIPKAQQNKIFSKLFRADNVRSSDTEGTGLGLYIVKAIVDQSGGSIKFESEENKGTKFVVTLPIKGMTKKEGVKSLA